MLSKEKIRELAFTKWVGNHDRYQAMEMLLTNQHVAKMFDLYVQAFSDGYTTCMVDNMVEDFE
jgi:hypothetical protein